MTKRTFEDTCIRPEFKKFKRPDGQYNNNRKLYTSSNYNIMKQLNERYRVRLVRQNDQYFNTMKAVRKIISIKLGKISQTKITGTIIYPNMVKHTKF